VVATFPGIQFGPLYYHQLENEKIQAIKDLRGHFDSLMVISNIAKMDL